MKYLLLCAPLLCAAVELPVQRVTLSAEGCIIERSALVPAGTTSIEGLPPAAAQALVLIDGHVLTEPEYSFDKPKAAAEQASALALARDAVLAAERAVQRAQQRQSLAQMLFTQVNPAPEQGVPPMPTAAEIQSRADFIQGNREQSLRELAQAVASRATAQAQLDQLQGQAALQSTTGLLRIPALDTDSVVRLQYQVSGSWSPRYRAELQGDQVRLSRLAQVSLPALEPWVALPLQLRSPEKQRPVLLPELPLRLVGMPEATPNFAEPRSPRTAIDDAEAGGGAAFMAIGAGGGAQGAFGSRTGAGKKRAVGMYGGTRRSENLVDAGLQWTRTLQREDGSWGDGPFPVASHSLVMLAVLGAGYDHKTPNKYRKSMQQAVDWLSRQNLQRATLLELCLAAQVVSEAYGMTLDRELKATCETVLSHFRQRVLFGGELAAGLRASGSLAGPELAFWVVAAAKSALASGLAPDTLWKQIISGVNELAAGSSDPEEARISEVVIGYYTGKKCVVSAQEWARYVDRVPRWYAQGRLELIYLVQMAAFQEGGEVWNQMNPVVRELLVEKLSNGYSSAPYAPGQTAATALALMTLEVYYRNYAPVSQFGIRSLPTAQAPQIEWNDWPLQLQSQPCAGTGGAVTVAIDSTMLATRAQLVCIPAQDPYAWYQLEANNPWPQALPGAPLQIIFADGTAVDSRLPFTPPTGLLRFRLGRNDGVRVERSAEVKSDEGWQRRTLQVRLRFVCQAPAEAGKVQVIEALPVVPEQSEVSCTLLSPQLEIDEWNRLRAEDPFLRFSLSPGEEYQIEYRFVYPTDVLPVWEYR